MGKNTKLNMWLWKWHFIAGMISLPFILVLAVSGGWYLFKDIIEQPETDRAKVVDIKGIPISFQEQWEIAQRSTTKHINTVVLPETRNEATEFVSGRFSNTLESIYIDPFTGDITNHRVVRNTFMYKVRKFHGELLMGSFGTKIVELAACWMIVLILTGIYNMVAQTKMEEQGPVYSTDTVWKTHFLQGSARGDFFLDINPVIDNSRRRITLDRCFRA